MKRFSSLIVLLSVLSACGSGDSDEDAEQSSAELACKSFTAGDDVCKLPFDARALRAIDKVSTMSKSAHDALATVETACMQGLADLGRTDVPAHESCRALVLAIRPTIPTLTISVEQPSCTKEPGPPCIAADVTRLVCTDGAVTATPRHDATDFERTVARAIARSYPLVFRARSEHLQFFTLAGDATSDVGALPAGCAVPIGAMTRGLADEAIATGNQISIVLNVITDRL